MGSFTFGPGHRSTFNDSQSHQVDQLVQCAVAGSVAGLFVNGTDLKSWCCPVTRRFSAAVKVQHIFAGVTLRICYIHVVCSV